MDSLIKLVHKEVNFSLCILCQKRKRDNLRRATENGLARLSVALEAREEHLDCNNVASIVNLGDTLVRENYKMINYHHACYLNFTSEHKIERLKKRGETSMAGEQPSSTRVTRSSPGAATNESLCILCQIDFKPESLRRVSTEQINKRICDLATIDFDLKRRLSKTRDTKTGNVRYHTFCLINRERVVKQVPIHNNMTSDTDLHNRSFLRLSQELRISAVKGQVLQLCVVFARYVSLVKAMGEEVPQSYMSRMSTFKERLKEFINDIYEFYQPLHRDIYERQTLLIPRQCAHTLTVDAIFRSNMGDVDGASSFIPADSQVMDIVHVAMRLRGDLSSAPSHQGLNVSKEEATSVIPESIHLFLSILLGGQDVIDNAFQTTDGSVLTSDVEDTEGDIESSLSYKQMNRIMSVAQDLVFIASQGKKTTSKHIGLGFLLHQKTRSKRLVVVEVFNKAGHCISYDQLMQMDTGLAKITLNSLDLETGAVIPPNLCPVPHIDSDTRPRVPLLHITADNVDLLTDTLDGKNTFHATQMVGFQRGAACTDDVLRSAEGSKAASLTVPPALVKLSRSNIQRGSVSPPYAGSVNPAWYSNDGGEIPTCVLDSNSLDLTFVFHRETVNKKMGWTEFNVNATNNVSCMSSAGYMPLILNPAHEMDTLLTVLKRCISVADRMGHQYATLTVDQDLYCRLIELMWNNKAFQDKIVLRMGGLHIVALNFLKAIGQHMSGCGLAEVWVESGVLAEGSVMKGLQGKAYSKGMRAHKLTFQALWQILLPQFNTFLAEEEITLEGSITDCLRNADDLYSILRESNIHAHLRVFVKKHESMSVNFKFWWSYVEMISVLLRFTRSTRDGQWELYLCSLTEMLPYLAWYDHLNYFKSLVTYIAEMHLLPPDVEAAFRGGDFVVRRSKGKFNAVDPDHAQEWIVGEGKSSGGIVGISNDPAALQRWALTYHWRTDIALKTQELFDIKHRSDLHSELYPGRRSRDERDENFLMEVLKRFTVFSEQITGHQETLQNLATKDQATKAIQDSLLGAKEGGKHIVEEFVLNRLSDQPSVAFHHSMKKNQPTTFMNLYVNKPSREKSEKVVKKTDRSIMQEIIAAYEGGRVVDLESILKHELLPIPPSLAEPDGSLRTGDKAQLVTVLTKDKVPCPEILETDHSPIS